MRSMRMEQTDWHTRMIEDIFQTKANFNRQRRQQKTVYNGRSAFMRFHSLSATSVKVRWDALPQKEKDYWADIAKRLNEDAAD